MKKILVIIFIIIPTILLGQSIIEVNQIDTLTKKRVIISKWERTYLLELYMRLRLQNDTTFIDMKFSSCENISISPETKMILESATYDSANILTTDATYYSAMGSGANGVLGNNCLGMQASYYGDMQWFTDNNVGNIKITSDPFNFSINLTENASMRLKDLFTKFYDVVKEDFPEE